VLTLASFSETLLSMQIQLEWNYANFRVKGN
jgi:hypothetical protein